MSTKSSLIDISGSIGRCAAHVQWRCRLEALRRPAGRSSPVRMTSPSSSSRTSAGSVLLKWSIHIEVSTRIISSSVTTAVCEARGRLGPSCRALPDFLRCAARSAHAARHERRQSSPSVPSVPWPFRSALRRESRWCAWASLCACRIHRHTIHLLLGLHRRQARVTEVESARTSETFDAEPERVLALVLFLLHPAWFLGQQLAEREIIRV